MSRNLVASDMGFSRCKFVDGNGTNPVCFPHAVGIPARQTFDMEGPTRKDMVITLLEGAWTVGHTAMEQSEAPVARRDADWIFSPEYEALLCAGLSELFWGDASITFATGLPVEHYDRNTRLKERLIGEHRFRRNGGDWQTITIGEDSVVAVQGLGALLNQALDGNGYISPRPIPGTTKIWAKATVGIIDGGGATVNYSAFQGLNEVGKWTAGADLGLLGPIDAIARAIATDCPKLNPTSADVAQWLEDGQFTYMRKVHDMQPYAGGDPATARGPDLATGQHGVALHRSDGRDLVHRWAGLGAGHDHAPRS